MALGRGKGGSEDWKFRKFTPKSLKDFFSDLCVECEHLQLVNSHKLLETALQRMPATEGELAVYIEAVIAELSSRLFFFVPSHRSTYYERELVQKMISAFPRASEELRHAGHCYVYGEYTASVFHAMRACEIGLHALAVEIKGITIPIEVSQWNNLIESIESQIKLQGQQKKTTQRDADLQFFSSAASQFRYIKDAWRNHVSHAKQNYDEDQALAVMNHSSDFLNSLADGLSEPP
jgi:hypothetical protein